MGLGLACSSCPCQTLGSHAASRPGVCCFDGYCHNCLVPLVPSVCMRQMGEGGPSCHACGEWRFGNQPECLWLVDGIPLPLACPALSRPSALLPPSFPVALSVVHRSRLVVGPRGSSTSTQSLAWFSLRSWCLQLLCPPSPPPAYVTFVLPSLAHSPPPPPCEDVLVLAFVLASEALVVAVPQLATPRVLVSRRGPPPLPFCDTFLVVASLAGVVGTPCPRFGTPGRGLAVVATDWAPLPAQALATVGRGALGVARTPTGPAAGPPPRTPPTACWG
jgi:hypothetical protein